MFTGEELDDFERRLARLVQHAEAIRDWCILQLRDGYIGEVAWRESEELRQAVEHGRTRRCT